MFKNLLTIALFLTTTTTFAQRVTDKLDRGLVAVPAQSGGGNLVSWRIFGEEYYDVTYNLFCNGSRIASNLKVSNYNHTDGNSSSQYQVEAVVRGQSQGKSEAIRRWDNGYLRVPVAKVLDRNGQDATSDYIINDIALGDVTGDGISEFIVKRNSNVAASMSNKSRFHRHEVYDINGKLLWSIDLGPNMMAGADEQWDAIAFDWDRDGKAEVLLRGADNMIIHTASGKDINIGDMTVDTRWNGIEYTSTGNEYLLYLNGETGEPYQIGPASHPNYMVYPLPRGNDSDWGTGISGHRSTKHYFGAPFLNGRYASIFLGRGCYTKHHMKTFDVNPSTHQLSLVWEWKSDGLDGSWFGNGYHNFGIADVDEDGRDEIVFGSMVIDDNGKGLSTTGLGHGDAQHCRDFDPYRKGLEFFACNESQPNNNYRNATTSQIYYRQTGGGDDGRGMMGNFTNSYPGSQGRSVGSAMISSVADKEITEIDANAFIPWAYLSFRIYWDGDLLDEILDSPGTEREAIVHKPGTGRIFQSVGCKMNNWSKNNPCATGDIFGDWREEIVIREGDNSAFRIYTTPIATTFRNYTLWHDHQYRNAMVWQCIGYNQPPHVSYFMGEMEGITIAPPPLTMTGRTEIRNGDAISTVHDGQHILICENGNTSIQVNKGAAPYIATFNIPSHVEGQNSNSNITTSYSTCDVTGEAFTGTMRLVKQGDGILNLPKVQQTYTGETNIWAGTLSFDGTLRRSPLWLNRFATLHSDGGQFLSIKADYGSTIHVGTSGKASEITVDSLYAMGFGSRLVLDLYSEGFQADRINVAILKTEKKTTDIWQKYGPQYIQPVIEIVEHKATGSTTLEPGDYIIGKVGQLIGSLSQIKIEGVTELRTGLSIDADNNLVLSLGAVRGAADIVWTGAVSNVWDFAKTQNFYIASDAQQTPDYFVKGDIVNFTDAAARTAIRLEEDVVADTVYFTNSEKEYTLTGTGSLVDQSAFVKEGTGKVTISTESAYTGGNYLRGGTVSVSSLANKNKPKGNLGAVTSVGKFVMENGATLHTTAPVTNGSPIRLVGLAGGVINNTTTYNQDAPISGTVLVKKGTGWFKQSVANTMTKLIATEGTVEALDKMASSVEVQGNAALTGNGFLTTPIKVAEGATAKLTTVNRATTNLALTGNGQLTVFCATEKGNGYYATRTPLSLGLSKYEGTLVADATFPEDGRFTLDTSSGGAGWALSIPEGRTVQNSGKTLRMGRLTGKGVLGGFSAFRNGISDVANTWQVGNDTLDYIFEGIVTRIDNFAKMGKSQMTVKGKWDNTGTVTISAGTLMLDGGSLGTGALTVSYNATLCGVGTLSNATTTISGVIQPGKTLNAISGIIDLGGQNLTINSLGTYRTCVRRGSTQLNRGCTSLSNINKMTVNGTIEVVLSTFQSLSAGDTIRIFDCKTFSGMPKFILPRQFTWDTSRIKEGILAVVTKAVLEDVNKDGVVDTQDVLQVYEKMESTQTVDSSLSEDVNMDGVIDTQDVLQIYQYMNR